MIGIGAIVKAVGQAVDTAIERILKVTLGDRKPKLCPILIPVVRGRRGRRGHQG